MKEALWFLAGYGVGMIVLLFTEMICFYLKESPRDKEDGLPY